MSDSISRADVAHLASLARIALSDDELDRLGAELPKIIGHVAAVTTFVAQAEAQEPVPAMSHPQPISNVFRDDVVVPSLTPEQALSGAPAQEDGRFLVPKILGEE